MADISREEARAIVREVRIENGGTTDEDRRGATTDFLRSYDRLSTIAGNASRFLREELYSSDVRFVFELIQNAEDNEYTHAFSRGNRPYVKFTLSHDRIIIDSNENGFTEENFRAICSLNESTKTAARGHIGEKGVGFKSVFQVAYRVDIQSGPFVFYLQHRPGDSGLGMISPQHRDYETLPNNVTTRITLSLMTPDDFNDRARDFAVIPDPLILFFSKLQKISVAIVPREGPPSITSYERNQEGTSSWLKLVKSFNNTVEEHSYYTKKKTLTDLPQDPARGTLRQAEIILSFPIDADSRPIIRSQYVYSFLPLRQIGLNFPVQSNFITQANREGIRHCPWNYALRDGVCETFVEAVRYFCSQPSLQLEWLAYLPGRHIADPFWHPLREMIIARLKSCPVLLTRSGSLKCPERLQRLSSRHCDRHGQPLFDDLECEVYLSSGYSWSEYGQDLLSLGVTNISYPNLLARLDPYLRGLSPRILRSTLDDDWHTRVAELLMRAMRNFPNEFAVNARIRSMPLIPLSDGSLANNVAHDVIFPDDDEHNSIPTDLGLRMVERTTLRNRTRRSFFEALEVNYRGSRFVIDRILNRYTRGTGVTLDNSISHLHYLYSTLGREATLDDRIFLMDEQELPVYRRFVTIGREIVVGDLYFQTPGEYGSRRLAEMLESAAQEHGTEFAGMLFIHPSYVDAVPPHAGGHGRDWEDWLENVACVRRVPRLKETRSNRLSRLFGEVIELLPEMLIGLLKTYWLSYETEITADIVEALANAEVPCLGTDECYPLKATHFPTAELRNLCSQATISDQFQFFLPIPSSWSSDTAVGWEFLSNFQVGMQPDLRFFTDVLDVLTEQLDANAAQTGLFFVYEELSRRFNATPDGIRELFNESSAVCIPANTTRRARTVSLNQCVWNGLPCLLTKYALAVHREYSHNSYVENLFRNILSLRDARRATYIEELKFRKRGSRPSFEDLCAIYQELANIIGIDGQWETTRRDFEQHSLIYVPSDGSWQSPTSCLWANASRIGRKFGIRASYSRLEPFFVQGLSLQAPTSRTYVDQLHNLAEGPSPNIHDIKMAIDNLNQLRPRSADLDSLRHVRCLPVKAMDGSTQLATPSGHFFIMDRIEYREVFRSQAPVLDFSLEDVRKLRHVLRALGLGDRYASSSIEETTTVQRPGSEPSVRLTSEFRRKSKFFYRCAIHYETDLIQHDHLDVYRKFQNAALYESDGFSKTLSLSQGQLTVTAESSSGRLHIEERNGILRLFVPRDSGQREICYSTELPIALVRHLGISDPAATEGFSAVIMSSAAHLEAILDFKGIVRPPDTDSFDLESTTVEDQELEEDTQDILPSTPDFSDDTLSPEGGAVSVSLPASVLHSTQPAAIHAVQTLSNVTEPTSGPQSSLVWAEYDRSASQQRSHAPPSIFRPITLGTQYLDILEKVIEMARQAVFPSVEVLDLGGLVDTLPSSSENFINGTPFGNRSQDQMAHDSKIGAAGELYIFELLLQQGLPGFGHSNWRSTIRHNVSIHHEYERMARWRGTETADIVYNDTNSILTRLLINNGYLERTQWESACPEYFMEVKSTIGACETQFYMSKSQYRRMQSMRLPDPPSTSTRIYLIFRVFNLGTDSMRVRIYMDPETLRLDGRLQFTPESYTVTPGRQTV